MARIPQGDRNIALVFSSIFTLHHIIATDLSAAHACCKSSSLPHPKGALLASDQILMYTELIIMFMKSVWDDYLLCDMTHYAVSSHYKMGELWS